MVSPNPKCDLFVDSSSVAWIKGILVGPRCMVLTAFSRVWQMRR